MVLVILAQQHCRFEVFYGLFLGTHKLYSKALFLVYKQFVWSTLFVTVGKLYEHSIIEVVIIECTSNAAILIT